MLRTSGWLNARDAALTNSPWRCCRLTGFCRLYRPLKGKPDRPRETRRVVDG